jgi:5'-nucleotidase
MRILITNDDGVRASGIKLLAQKAIKYGEIIVVAPELEQSAKSHSITIRSGLEFKQIEDLVEGVKTYAVDSTPADCVRFAKYYLKDEFDIVFSGINNGYNVGEDIIYSGTVGAASEGVFCGKKAIAFSCTYNDTSEIEKWFDRIMDFVLQNNLLDYASLYNINVPLNAKGIKVTHQGKTYFETQFELVEDLVWQKGRPNFNKDEDQENSDVTALHNNYISITPLTVDRTDKEAFKKIIR